MPKLKLKGGISTNSIPKLNTDDVEISHRTILEFPKNDIKDTDNEYVKEYVNTYLKNELKNEKLKDLINYLNGGDLDLTTIDAKLKELLDPEEQALAKEAEEKEEADAKAADEAKAATEAEAERAAAAAAAAEAERAAAEAKKQEDDAQEAARLAALALEQANALAAAQAAEAKAEAERAESERLAAEAASIEAARIEAEWIESARIEAERVAKEEAEKLKNDKENAERLAEEKRVQAARVEAEKLEREAQAKATAEAAAKAAEVQAAAEEARAAAAAVKKKIADDRLLKLKEAKEARNAIASAKAEREARAKEAAQAKAAEEARVAEEAARLAKEESAAAARKARVDETNRLKAIELANRLKKEADEAEKLKKDKENAERIQQEQAAEAARIAKAAADQAIEAARAKAEAEQKALADAIAAAKSKAEAEAAAAAKAIEDARVKAEAEQKAAEKAKEEAEAAKQAALIAEAEKKQAENAAKAAADSKFMTEAKAEADKATEAIETFNKYFPTSIDGLKTTFINKYIKQLNPDEVVLAETIYLNGLQTRLVQYIPEGGIVFKDNKITENYTFQLKQSILTIIYYELYKTKYDDLLRASMFFEQITDKSLVSAWYDSSIKLSDALRIFLKVSIEPLLTRKNEAERPVDPSDLKFGTRGIQFAKGFTAGLMQGKSVKETAVGTAKELYGKKIYKNSINTNLNYIKKPKETEDNGLEDPLFELKKLNDANKNAFKEKLNGSADKSFLSIFAKPLKRDAKLGLKDKLKTHKPGSSQELVDDIDLWGKFWNSLPKKTPILAQSAPLPP